MTNSVLRGRIKAFDYLINSLEVTREKQSPRELLKVGFVHPSLQKQVEELTNTYATKESNEPLSLTEICTYNTFFEKNPEKVCGKEKLTTSRDFPIRLEGSKETIIETIDNSIEQIKNKGSKLKLAKAKSLVLKLKLQLATAQN